MTEVMRDRRGRLGVGLVALFLVALGAALLGSSSATGQQTQPPPGLEVPAVTDTELEDQDSGWYIVRPDGTQKGDPESELSYWMTKGAESDVPDTVRALPVFAGITANVLPNTPNLIGVQIASSGEVITAHVSEPADALGASNGSAKGSASRSGNSKVAQAASLSQCSDSWLCYWQHNSFQGNFGAICCTNSWVNVGGSLSNEISSIYNKRGHDSRMAWEHNGGGPKLCINQWGTRPDLSDYWNDRLSSGRRLTTPSAC